MILKSGFWGGGELTVVPPCGEKHLLKKINLTKHVGDLELTANKFAHIFAHLIGNLFYGEGKVAC